MAMAKGSNPQRNTHTEGTPPSCSPVTAMAGTVEGRGEEGLGSCRIFVGGLGEAVTESDLERTFSSLGKVNGVEVVRTKGRSFAYFDFLPFSDKSMGKLFSMYNGCMWKGGRLKIEKAKEHYLVRLKREWEEDASLVKEDSSLPKDGIFANKVLLERSKKGSSEQMQLHLYFPKLRKVKGVPFGGTGKHKYSFQRIDVPSTLPVHCCDCEEHSGSVPKLGRSNSPLNDTENGVINEEELNIMNSVMNKLFGREESAKLEQDLDTKKNSYMDEVDNNLLNNGEVDQSMDDDLVINIMTAGDGSKVDSVLLSEKETPSLNKPLQDRSLEARNKPARKKPKVQLMSDLANTTKYWEDFSHQSGSAERDFAVTKLEQSGTSSLSHATRSDIFVGDQSGDILKPSACQPMRGALWVQKSSWKDLVGIAGNSSFSVSDILC